MSKTDTVSPLRQRMIEDMAARNLNPHAQRSHIYSCKRFAAWLKRSQAGPKPERPDDLLRDLRPDGEDNEVAAVYDALIVGHDSNGWKMFRQPTRGPGVSGRNDHSRDGGLGERSRNDRLGDRTCPDEPDQTLTPPL